MPRPFMLIDVFSSEAFGGNPLAVVFDAEGLDTETMQRVTRWLNLSETAFLLSPTEPNADYRVRIFTLERELPFAGHPTLGSCHGWLAAGGKPKSPDRIVQQCEAGLIPIRRQESGLAFAAPPLLRTGPIAPDAMDEILAVLRIDAAEVVAAAWIDNGPGWAGVLLRSAEAVLAIEPARHHPRRIDIGAIGPHAAGDAAFELRAFFSDPHGAIVEDPVTGSLNASAAQWLIGSGRASPSYIAAQGTRIGRSGRVHVAAEGADVWIGGATRTMFSGETAF